MKTFVTLCASALWALCMPASAQNAWDETTPALDLVDYRPEGWLLEDELFFFLDAGEALFEAKFTAQDGAGRPNSTQAAIPHRPRKPLTQAFSRTSGPDASACSSCHNDPVSGGAGDYVTNVFTASGFANAVFDTTDPEFSNERGTNHLFGAGLVELLAREMTARTSITQASGADHCPRDAAACDRSLNRQRHLLWHADRFPRRNRGPEHDRRGRF